MERTENREKLPELLKQLWTAEDVARRYNVKVPTVYYWKRKGIIGCVKFGRALRFEPEVVEAFLAARRIEPTAPAEPAR
jgi:excisionase family DNA binding protein